MNPRPLPDELMILRAQSELPSSPRASDTPIAVTYRLSLTSRLPNRRKRRLGSSDQRRPITPDLRVESGLHLGAIERPESEPTIGRHHLRGERVGIAMRVGICELHDVRLARVPHTPRLAGINCRGGVET